MNVFSLAWPVSALGPGERVVLWVAGCGKRCAGCISPEMQSPDSGRQVPVDVLERRLLRLDATLSGITISGGEPFDQAQALSELVSALRVARPAWSVIIYTGHVLATLRRRPEAAGLLKCTDVLIAGPYRQDVPPTHPLAGSGNQRLHLLSPRGRAIKIELDACQPDAANFGLGAGSFNMIIGVTKSASRDAMRGAIFGEGDLGSESQRCNT